MQQQPRQSNHKKIAPLLKRAMGALGIAFVSLMLILSPAQPVPTLSQSQNSVLHAGFQFNVAYAADPAPTSAASGGAQGSASDALDCSIGSPLGCVTLLVYWIAVAIPSYFAYITGSLFGIAVRASLDSSAYALTFLANGWTVMRDIANMAFLFILIYIALTIMFKAETHGTLGMLTTVIIVALLVNFSFFITRVVIDGGNILAIQVYNAIPTPDTVNKGSALDVVHAKDLSGAIMGSLNAQNLLGLNSFDQWKDAGGKNPWSRLITLSAVFIPIGIVAAILAFAFLVAAINFIGRIVVLWFCIILAPAAWAAAAVPGFSGYYKKWQDALIKHAIYPAVFLFSFLLITLLMKAISGPSSTLYNSIFNSLNQNNVPGLDGVLVGVEIVLIQLSFVILMLKFTFKFSEDMGLATAGVAEKVRGWTQENITGRYRRAATSPLRGAWWAARWVPSKGYQQGVARTANTLDKGLGRTWFGNSIVGDVARRNVVRPVADSHFGPALTYREWRKEEDDRQKGMKGYKKGQKAPEYHELAEKEAALEKPTKEYDSNAKRLEELEFDNMTKGTLSAPAQTELRNLEGYFKAIPQRPSLTAEEQDSKNKLKASAIDSADERTFEAMSPAELKRFAHLYSEKQLEMIKKLDSFTLSQKDKDEIEKKWKTRGTIANPLGGNYGSADNALNQFDKSVKELTEKAAKLGVSIDLSRKSGEDMKKILERNREALEKNREKLAEKKTDIRQPLNQTINDLRKTNKRLDEIVQDPVANRAEIDRLQKEKQRLEEEKEGHEAQMARITAEMKAHREVETEFEKTEKKRDPIPQNKDAVSGKEYAKGDTDIRR